VRIDSRQLIDQTKGFDWRVTREQNVKGRSPKRNWVGSLGYRGLRRRCLDAEGKTDGSLWA
jgi:hypothetical protein